MQNSNTSFFNTRAVMGLLNRITGTPVTFGSGSDGQSMIPLNQAILSVGLFDKPQGRHNKARVALYGFKPTGGLFRFGVDIFDGVPELDRNKLIGATGMSDMAAINWTMGALFSKSVPGIYELIQTEPLPKNSRTLFSTERCWESTVQLFKKSMSSIPVNNLRFSPTEVVPVLTADRLTGIAPEYLNIIAAKYNLSRGEFRNHATNKFMQAIHKASPELRNALKVEFLGYFRILNHLSTPRSVEWSNQVLHQAQKQVASMVPYFYTKLKKYSDMNDQQMEDATKNLTEAKDLVEFFMAQGNSEEIPCYVPISGKPVHEKFNNPSLHGVTGVPFQISDNFLTDGKFPGSPDEMFGDSQFSR